MLSEVRSYYGFAKDFAQAGYFETEQSQQIVKELIYEIRAGKLITVSGIIGCGETTVLRRIQDMLAREREILVAKSLSGGEEPNQLAGVDQRTLLRSGHREGLQDSDAAREA